MNWEHDSGEEARDRTPLLWIGVVVLVVGMVAALWAVTKAERAQETRAHVSHILLKFDPLDEADRERALKTAQEVRQKIIEGADFDAMAEEYTEDEITQPRGGDLGWVSKGILVTPVDQVIWQIPIGEVSGAIESQYGIHLVMVEERTISELDQYEQHIRDRVFGNIRRTPDGEKPVAPAEGEGAAES